MDARQFQDLQEISDSLVTASDECADCECQAVAAELAALVAELVRNKEISAVFPERT